MSAFPPNHAHPFRGIGLIVGIGVLIAVAVSPLLRAPGLRTEATPSPFGDAAIERGAALFLANCAACHGPGGKGDGPVAAALVPKPTDLTGPAARQRPDTELANRIANGVDGSAMPPFAGTLTDAQIGDLISYIRSLQAPAAAAPGTGTPAP